MLTSFVEFLRAGYDVLDIKAAVKSCRMFGKILRENVISYFLHFTDQDQETIKRRPK